MEFLNYLAPVVGVAALVFAYTKVSFIKSVEPGTERMKEISGYIEDGAMAFLSREYKVIGIFMAVMFGVLLAIGRGSIAMPLTFLFGAVFSLLAGYIGMSVATKANVRTTNMAMLTTTQIRITDLLLILTGQLTKMEIK